MVPVRTPAHAALFSVGLLGTATLLDQIDALPFWSWSRPRYADAQTNAGRHDILIFGSSRAHYGIIPAVLDEELSGLGHKYTAYNLAISGQRAHDSARTIEWMLDQGVGSASIAIIELHSWDQRQRGTDWMTDQTIEMHRIDNLAARLSTIADSRQSLADKLRTACSATAHTATNLLKVGQGSRILNDLLAASRGQQLPNTWRVEERGFKPSDIDASEFSRTEAAKLANDPNRGKELLKFKWSKEELDRMTGGFNFEEFARIDARVRSAGLLPVYVTIPSMYSTFHGYDAVRQLSEEHIVLDFDQPSDPYDLFDRRHYFDPGHFSRNGAEHFTRVLARALLAKLPATPPQPPAAQPGR
jgi:hypothetical protein